MTCLPGVFAMVLLAACTHEEPGDDDPRGAVDDPVARAGVDPAAELVLAGRGARSVSHVLCTGATTRRVADFPFVATDYALEQRALLAGEPAPSTLTLPGAGGDDDIAAGLVAPRVGEHYLIFFDDAPGGATRLGMLVPARSDGAIELAGRSFARAEVQALVMGGRLTPSWPAAPADR